MDRSANDYSLRRAFVLGVAACTAAFASSSAWADPGHCVFEQYSPGVKRWYSQCQMPASQSDCEALATGEGTTNAKFGNGACKTAGVVTGACQVGSHRIFYYEGSASDVAAGCELIGGAWQAGVTPTSVAAQ